MPYSINKKKCKQSDGDAGSYVLSYVDDKGKKHRNCNTSKKKAKAQISAIEMDEGWRPLAVKITQLLEEELAELAGELFTGHESDQSCSDESTK